MRFDTRYEKVQTKTNFLGGKVKFIQLRSKREVTFLDAFDELNDHRTSLIRWLTRCDKLSEGGSADYESKNYDWDRSRFENFVEELGYLVDAWRENIVKTEEEKPVREKIAALRNTTGRTEEEIEIFLAKADELEKKLDSR